MEASRMLSVGVKYKTFTRSRFSVDLYAPVKSAP